MVYGANSKEFTHLLQKKRLTYLSDGEIVEGLKVYENVCRRIELFSGLATLPSINLIYVFLISPYRDTVHILYI